MNLSDANPYIGMRVISHKNNSGSITEIHEANEDEVHMWRSCDIVLGDKIITITWDHGKLSIFPLKTLDAVTVKAN